MSDLLLLSYRGVSWIVKQTWNFFWFLVRIVEAIKYHQVVKYVNPPMDSLSMNRLSLVPRKIFVLDLDETLIHSAIASPFGISIPSDFEMKMDDKFGCVVFNVRKRPYVDFFLDTVSKWYELVIYTASLEKYGSSIIDKLDNNRGILTRRYYRQHCTLESGSYTKDLSLISNDLSNIFIMDNSPGAYKGYPDNAIPITSWYSDRSDTALLSILPFLDALRFTGDVRSVLRNNMRI